MMKKKIFIGLFSFVMCMLLLPIAGMKLEAEPLQEVAYTDGNGIEKKCTDYTKITKDTKVWSDGWYVAEGEVDIPERVEVSGNVHLILTEGCNLEINGGIHASSNDGSNSLTIYAQSMPGTGRLNAKNVFWRCAAIGGNPEEDGATITINGGIISSDGSYGIGGGHAPLENTNGNIIINGGIINVAPFNPGKSGSVMICPPDGYAIIIRKSDEKFEQISGSPFTSSEDIKDKISESWVSIMQTPLTKHKIIFEFDGPGSATATPDSAIAGDHVLIAATPDRCYHFVKWESDDVEITENVVFLMPAKDITIKAFFEHNPNIHYLDEKGIDREIAEEKIVRISELDKTDEWTEGWYLADGIVDIEERVQVKGDVHLILADNCELTTKKGIRVSGEENSLTIYGQSTGGNAGYLSAVTAQMPYYAGIGGDDSEDSGQITINGGRINASAGTGIGGGGGADGYVTINGGDVTAKTIYYGTGIGGGPKGGDGYVTINGGKVIAEVQGNGAGIGSGDTLFASRIKETSGHIIINGGTIDSYSYGGAAIGGGHGKNSEITINGGEITARCRSTEGTAIGPSGGELGKYDTKSCITITGGIVHAYSNEVDAISPGSGGWVKAELQEGFFMEAKGNDDADLKDSPLFSGDIFEHIKGYSELHLIVAPYHTIYCTVDGEGSVELKNGTQASEGKKIELEAMPGPFSDMTCSSEDVEINQKNNNLSFIMPDKDVHVTVSFEKRDVSYIDIDGITKTIKDYTTVTDETTVWDGGFYAIAGECTIPKRVEVIGDVSLILTDRSELEIPEGIHVGPKASLTIYEQGFLVNRGILRAGTTKIGLAAIGGNNMENCGAITINGGRITAITDSSGAGIGGGYAGKGSIVINKGDVKAKSAYGAGIGSGSGCYSPAEVTINGGTVNAQGTKKGGAGIGGGLNGVAHVTITGGTVDAVSENGEAIHAGKSGSVLLKPAGGRTLMVKIEGKEISGSPFETENDLTGIVNKKLSVYISDKNSESDVPEPYEPESDVPKTGDDSCSTLWLVLLLVGAGLLAVSTLFVKKEKR